MKFLNRKCIFFHDWGAYVMQDASTCYRDCLKCGKREYFSTIIKN